MPEYQNHSDTEKNRNNDSHSAPVSLSSLLGLLSKSYRHHRRRLLIGFIALISVDFLQLTIPRIIKRGVDALADRQADAVYLLKLGGIIIAIATTVVFLRFCWRTLLIGFSRYMEQSLRDRIFNHILTMDQPFFDRRTTGDIMAHSSNDLAAIQMACGMGMVAAADALVLSIAAIGFMLLIHPQLTLLSLLPMPLLAIATRILSGRLHTRFNLVQEQFSLLTEFARSTLISIRLSKAYTLEAFQGNLFDRLSRDYVKANISVAMIQGLLFPVAALIGNLGLLAILVYGGRLVISETISIGDFVAFMTYLQMLIWPMMAVGWVTNLIQRGITSLRRIHTLLHTKPLLNSPAVMPPAIPSVSSPVFRLNNLSFNYPHADTVLHNISFETTGGIIGIAGPTGSGKSTLCRLLLRLYPVHKGQLFYNEIDVNQLPLDTIRSYIGFVSQEPVLFSDSVRNNIAFGNPDVSLEKIEKAARDADIHNDIVSFPEGYETIIGERGLSLSGGQRQRLALARALLCERPVLIIDDGLSAVDTTTESRIINTLRSSLHKKTVVIVSNRIKLLTMTDHILIIERGRLTAAGSHQHLVEHNLFYRSMHLKQMNLDLKDRHDAR
ncbi:MAG: multidrug ABC transporter ATP-binding protein [Desulfobacterales bacterium]|nr:MAG: multidrug ABC transporter ATP-binding protein [Desulfobacterales bacterium]